MPPLNLPLARIAEAILLTAIGWLLWNRIPWFSDSSPSQADHRLSRTISRLADVAAMSAQIRAAQLFGAAPRNDSNLSDAAIGKLQLTGVLTSGTFDSQLAILVAADGASRLYRRGDVLPGGTVLDEVGTDYVLLLQGRQRIRIGLRSRWARGGLAGSSALANSVEIGAATGIDQDTRSTLQVLGLAIVSAAADGATALSGKGPDTWRTAGLLGSDVIVSIDGVDVGSFLSQRGALDRAVQSAVTTLTVERNGQKLQLEAQQPRTVTRRRRALR